MDRKQTPDEIAYLEKLLSNLPSESRRIRMVIGEFVVLLAITTLAWVLIWGGIGWVAAKTGDVDIGWWSPHAALIALSIVAASAIYALYSTAQWIRSWPDYRDRVRQDLACGSVSEERLVVLEAKVLQEPEHGGLMYFLRLGDDRVLVLFDRESIDLAMADEDPMGGRFEAQSALTIVRAPRSGFTISATFSGDDIDIYGPFEITVSPDRWPDDEEFIQIPWDEIESQLCA